MKKFKKFILFLLLLCCAAAAAAPLYRRAAGSAAALPEEPLFTVTVAGNIARNSLSAGGGQKRLRELLQRFAGGDRPVLAHYDDPSPSGREKKALREAGLSAVTLPYLTDEDLAYLKAGGEYTNKPRLREEAAVLYLAEDTGLTVLSFPPDTDAGEMADILGNTDAGYALIVRVESGGAAGDGERFRSLARTAIDHGAHLVIGDDRGGFPRVEMYGQGVIIPYLGPLLGEEDGKSAIVTLDIFTGGVRAEIVPLSVTDGLPALYRPWHYFQARDDLRNMAGYGFEILPFMARHISPALLRAGEAAGEDPAAGPGGGAAAAGYQYGVAAGHPLAAAVGMEILRAGGNAVDAAAAVAYALAVVEPDGSGLGGGGIMLLHLAEENRQIVIDYRETAPSTMARADIEKIMNWPGTGIPGFVRGLEKAVANYGTLPYAEVIRPAYHLARDGFALTPRLQASVRRNSGKLARSREALAVFFRDGWPAKTGEIIKQPTLARTLRSIMEEGSGVFYEGYISDSIISVLRDQGAHLSRRDFADYLPVVREPLSVEYGDFTVVSVPPPAGGFNVLQQLMILRHFEISRFGGPEDEVYRLLEQVMKSTYSDRRNYIGDPNFVHVEIAELLSDGYAAEKVAQIKAGNVPLTMYTDPYRPSDNTTHFVVADSRGNWASVTNTLSFLFGNGLTAEGFFLNSQLKNFSSDPSSPNYFQSGKRPFSHISPVLVLRDGVPFLGLGSPGGRRIPAYLVQVLMLMADFNLTVTEAVNHPRFWSEGRTVWLEKGMPGDIVAGFKKRGYRVVTRDYSAYFGRMAAVYRDTETKKITGTGDPRRGDGVFLAE